MRDIRGAVKASESWTGARGRSEMMGEMVGLLQAMMRGMEGCFARRGYLSAWDCFAFQALPER